MLDQGRVVVDGTAVEGLRPSGTLRATRPDGPGTRDSGSGPAPRRAPQRRRQPARLSPGDSLTVEIDVVAHEPTEDWVVGIALINHVDLIAYGTNTHLLGVDLRRLDGRRPFASTCRMSLSPRARTT